MLRGRGWEEAPLSTTRTTPYPFDSLAPERALAELMTCCASPRWADRMVAGRPYGTLERLLSYADTVLEELDESEIDKALAGHPRIGERSEQALSRREQAGVADADTGVLAALAEANRDYERRFEHVYLVCADRRSAHELLDVLRSRLGNDRPTERRVLRSELAKINRLRLIRMCT